jgi:hypothetical protein
MRGSVQRADLLRIAPWNVNSATGEPTNFCVANLKASLRRILSLGLRLNTTLRSTFPWERARRASSG